MSLKKGRCGVFSGEEASFSLNGNTGQNLWSGWLPSELGAVLFSYEADDEDEDEDEDEEMEEEVSAPPSDRMMRGNNTSNQSWIERMGMEIR